jgi:23S rRNA-/tRNA-specific pseudouridylate synthase
VKPPGIVVHPCASVPIGTTLLDGILHHLLATAKMAPLDAVPPVGSLELALTQGVVHRLDKETSGVVVVAKTLEASSNLSRQFISRDVDKRYLALCVGTDPGLDEMVDVPLTRKSNGKVIVVLGTPTISLNSSSSSSSKRGRHGTTGQASGSAAGVKAVTRFRTAARWQGVSVVEVDLFTGRMHQIRVHAAHRGHPVAGDAMHGKSIGEGGGHNTKESEAALGLLNLQGLMLHAWQLSFNHPATGRRLHLTAAPPASMARAMRSVAARAGSSKAGLRESHSDNPNSSPELRLLLTEPSATKEKSRPAPQKMKKK